MTTKTYQVGDLVKYRSHKKNYHLIVREDLGEKVSGRIKVFDSEDLMAQGRLIQIDKAQIL